MEPCLEGARHQRHVPRAAGIHPSARTPRPKDEGVGQEFPQPSRVPAVRRRTLVARCRSRRHAGVANGVVHCRGAAAPLPYGVLTREVAGAEGIYGGFSAVYDVLKAMEDAGRIRRGYFVSGVGATQFALPAALELMRSLREMPDEPETIVLSATDPANPYGTMLKWPGQADGEGSGRGATRTVGSRVILVNGVLAGYIPRGGRQLLVLRAR